LRRCRERCGLTQGALAALIGFSPQHLSDVERGAGSVSEQFVQACDDALGADGLLVKLLPPVVYERARARWSNRAERQSVATEALDPGAPSLALSQERPIPLTRRALLPRRTRRSSQR
jgi:transcriptional regulator with XRE-family HTH domain